MKIRCLFNIKKKVPFMLRGKNEYVCKGLNILEVINFEKEYDNPMKGEFKKNFLVEPVNGQCFSKQEVLKELNFLTQKASVVID